MRPNLVLVTAATLVAGLLGSAPADAQEAGATTLGQTGSGVVCGITAPAAVVIDTQGVGAASYVAAKPGVITSFSHQANGTGGQVRAIVFADGASTLQKTVVAKTDKFTVARNTLNTFPARLPIKPGQRLGLGYTSTSMACVTAGASGDATLAEASFDPDTSSTFVASGVVANGSGPLRPNISAVVEPDRDKDGYGDITQDGCPASAKVQALCPNTKITKRPGHKSTRSKVKVKVKFTSTVPGSTFECRLDHHRKWKGCASPFKARLGVGRHVLQVRAVTPAGVADPKPAKVRFGISRS